MPCNRVFYQNEKIIRAAIFTCSKSTIKTPEQNMKYVQS